MEKINVYKFIWSFIKLRKFDCFIWLLIEVSNDIIGIFVAQYFNKKMISYFEIENAALKTGLFLVFLYIFFNNVNNLFKPLKLKARFKFADYIKKSIRNTLFSYTIQHSMDYFNNSFAGSLNNKINVAVRSIGSILYNLKEIICYTIVLFCIPLFYAKINVYIGLVFFFGFIIYFFALINIRKKFIENRNELSEMVSKYFGLINDDFLNISNIKIFSNQIFERRNVKRQNIKIMRKEYKSTKIQILFYSINFLCNFLLFFSTLGIAGYLLANGKISIADFTYVVIITSISRWLIISGLKALTIIYSSIGDLQNALDTIYKPIDIKNKNNSKNLISTEGKIIFKNVRFGYEK